MGGASPCVLGSTASGPGPWAARQALITPVVTTHQVAQSLGAGPQARVWLNSSSSVPVQT